MLKFLRCQGGQVINLNLVQLIDVLEEDEQGDGFQVVAFFHQEDEAYSVISEHPTKADADVRLSEIANELVRNGMGQQHILNFYQGDNSNG